MCTSACACADSPARTSRPADWPLSPEYQMLHNECAHATFRTLYTRSATVPWRVFDGTVRLNESPDDLHAFFAKLSEQAGPRSTVDFYPPLSDWSILDAVQRTLTDAGLGRALKFLVRQCSSFATTVELRGEAKGGRVTVPIRMRVSLRPSAFACFPGTDHLPDDGVSTLLKLAGVARAVQQEVAVDAAAPPPVKFSRRGGGGNDGGESSCGLPEPHRSLPPQGDNLASPHMID